MAPILDIARRRLATARERRLAVGGAALLAGSLGIAAYAYTRGGKTSGSKSARADRGYLDVTKSDEERRAALMKADPMSDVLSEYRALITLLTDPELVAQMLCVVPECARWLDRTMRDGASDALFELADKGHVGSGAAIAAFHFLGLKLRDFTPSNANVDEYIIAFAQTKARATAVELCQFGLALAASTRTQIERTRVADSFAAIVEAAQLDVTTLPAPSALIRIGSAHGAALARSVCVLIKRCGVGFAGQVMALLRTGIAGACNAKDKAPALGMLLFFHALVTTGDLAWKEEQTKLDEPIRDFIVLQDGAWYTLLQERYLLRKPSAPQIAARVRSDDALLFWRAFPSEFEGSLDAKSESKAAFVAQNTYRLAELARGGLVELDAIPGTATAGDICRLVDELSVETIHPWAASLRMLVEGKGPDAERKVLACLVRTGVPGMQIDALRLRATVTEANEDEFMSILRSVSAQSKAPTNAIVEWARETADAGFSDIAGLIATDGAPVCTDASLLARTWYRDMRGRHDAAQAETLETMLKARAPVDREALLSLVEDLVSRVKARGLDWHTEMDGVVKALRLPVGVGSMLYT
jgi:hypothetical protein